MENYLAFYEEFTASYIYIAVLAVSIGMAFLLGKILPRYMMTQFKDKRYSKVEDIIAEGKNMLQVQWQKAFVQKEKAVTYLCLAVVMAPSLLYAILKEKRNGIEIAVTAFTFTLAVMEYRDNNSASNELIEELEEKQLELLRDADDLASMSFRDDVIDRMVEKKQITEEEAKELRKSLERKGED